MGYKKDTIQGISWMAGLRGTTRVLSFARTAVLARILLPSQFGVYGIATLTLAFLETITASGINVFLIQEKKKLEEYVDTAWIVSILRGIFITLVIIFLSPLIASFFATPSAKNIIILIGLVSFLRGFINPSRIKFRKDLDFKKEFWFSGAIFFVDTLVSIVLAFTLRSPVSLVWGLVAGVVLEVLLSFVLIKPIPKLSFDLKKATNILNRGKWVSAAGIFNYAFKQGDDAVVGKLLNTSALGFYQVAYKISTLPITEITQVFNKVTFPVYTRMAGDKTRLKKAFLKTLFVVSAFSIPIGLLLYIFPREVILIVLGNNWLEAVPALKVLAVFGVIRAITTSTSPLFLANKKQEYITFVNLVGVAGMAVTIIPLVKSYGIVGAGVSTIVGALASLPVIIYFSWTVLR